MNILKKFFEKNKGEIVVVLDTGDDTQLLSYDYGVVLAENQVLPLIRDESFLSLVFSDTVKEVNVDFFNGLLSTILKKYKNENLKMKISANRDIVKSFNQFCLSTKESVEEERKEQRKIYEDDLKSVGG